jgi:hypothetical protein
VGQTGALTDGSSDDGFRRAPVRGEQVDGINWPFSGIMAMNVIFMAAR